MTVDITHLSEPFLATSIQDIYEEADSLLSRGKTLKLQDNKLTSESACGRFWRKLSARSNLKALTKISDFILNRLNESKKEPEIQSLLRVGKKWLKKHLKNRSCSKVLKAFDRALGKFDNEYLYLHPNNQAEFAKWRKYKFNEIAFRTHPKFCDFLIKTKLSSQMKVTRDNIHMIGGIPHIKYKNRFISHEELTERFEVVDAPRYNEALLVKKEDRTVHTYLDNGYGLQPHHPFLTELNPISHIDEKDYNKVMQSARKFIREEEKDLTENERENLNEKRPYIIQVVTSLVKGSNNKMIELVQRRKHPYLRIIAGENNPVSHTLKGNVYEVGFGWKKRPLFPLGAVQGQFRSIDRWEFKDCQEKVVTNIPVSREEALKLYLFTIRHHRDGVNLGKEIGFQLSTQNCSVFVRKALEVAGIKAPTEATLFGVLARGAGRKPKPDRKYAKVKKENSNTGDTKPPKYTKGVKSYFKRFFGGLTTLFLTPLGCCLGGAIGEGGRAFPGEGDSMVEPPLQNWKNYFKLTRHNLPGILQEWQRNQASTEIYKNPIRLTIVPLDKDKDVPS